jgi:hypothetical protein
MVMYLEKISFLISSIDISYSTSKEVFILITLLIIILIIFADLLKFQKFYK